MRCRLFDLASRFQVVVQRTFLAGLATVGLMGTANAQSVCVFDPAGKAEIIIDCLINML